MNALRDVLLLMVAAGGLGVVLTRDPLRQALVVGVYGLLLSLLFFVFEAPDVALSEIVVSTVGVPAMILFAIAKVRRHDRDREGEDG